MEQLAFQAAKYLEQAHETMSRLYVEAAASGAFGGGDMEVLDATICDLQGFQALVNGIGRDLAKLKAAQGAKPQAA